MINENILDKKRSNRYMKERKTITIHNTVISDLNEIKNKYNIKSHSDAIKNLIKIEKELEKQNKIEKGVICSKCEKDIDLGFLNSRIDISRFVHNDIDGNNCYGYMKEILKVKKEKDEIEQREEIKKLIESRLTEQEKERINQIMKSDLSEQEKNEQTRSILKGMKEREKENQIVLEF